MGSDRPEAAPSHDHAADGDAGAPQGLAAVFEPRRIVLVGASERPGTMGRLLWDNLRSFPGDVVPVGRSAAIDGVPAYAAISDVPGPLDLAVIGLPADRVLAAVRAAAEQGVGAAVVLTAGFAETGEAGAALQADVVRAARAGGMRIVGPNCFGVQNCDLPLNASIAPDAPPAGPSGGISLVTQSGSYGMAVHALGLDESMRFAKVYAAGNKADLTDAEVLAYLRADPATRVVCLLMESITGGPEFFAEARRTAAVKPVIATVTGRSAAGQRAALSHTAALAADERLRSGALAQAGVARAASGQQMLDAARLLTDQPPPRGPRVGIVTNSGGLGVELTDLLHEEGLVVPELSAGLQAGLRELLPEYGSPRNPVDLTPIWSRYAELYPALTDQLARSGEVDVVLPIVLARAGSPEVVAGLLAVDEGLRCDGIDVAVYACWVAARSFQEQADVLQRGGVPVLYWPERAAAATGMAVRCAAALGGAADLPSSPTGPGAGAGRGRELLVAAGVPCVATEPARSAAAAVAAADRLGYPVVCKVEHPELSHKSDVGGVRLGLADAAAVEAAAAQLLALRPGASVLVQASGSGLEIVVGGLRDPAYGPVVMVGLGGVLVEILGDVAFALAPVTAEYAGTMLRTLRGAAVLDGVRGAPAVDVGALAAVVVAVGELIAGVPDIAEIDLNPVLAGPHGVLAVDWRILRTDGRLDEALG